MLKSSKTYLPKLNLGILVLLAFLMPIYQKPLGLLIGLFTLFTIVDGVINKTFVFNNNKIFITGILFFLMHLISVIYSQNQERAWFDIEVKLSLIIFPILFFFKNNYIIKYKKWILNSFVISTAIANIYMILSSYLIYHGNEWIFHSSYLTKYIHPSYISMYNLFSIVFIIQNIKTYSRLIKYGSIIGVVFLLFMIYLFESKAGFIAFIFITTYITIIFFLRINNKFLQILIPLIIISSTTYMVSQNHRMQKMFKSILEIVQTGDSSTASTGIRFEIWKTSTQIIKRHPLIGVGAGDIKTELNKKYKENPSLYKEALKNQFNVHNQYLETFLGQGIIGLSLLLLMLFWGIKYAYQNKDHLFASFLIIISINFFPESLLNNRAGVIFFAFFYFFLTQEKKKNLNEIKE